MTEQELIQLLKNNLRVEVAVMPVSYDRVNRLEAVAKVYYGDELLTQNIVMGAKDYHSYNGGAFVINDDWENPVDYVDYITK